MTRFETYAKTNGRYYFIGWYEIATRNLVNSRTRLINGKRHLYNTYKLLNGDIEEYKYILD